MKNVIRNLLLLPLCALCWGCECEVLPVSPGFLISTLVVSEELPDEEPDDGVFCVRLLMSDAVVPGSVVVNETVIAEDILLDFVRARTSTIEVCALVPANCPPMGPCGRSFTLRLRGATENGILSTREDLLDGDYNGTPGGDFVATYNY